MSDLCGCSAVLFPVFAAHLALASDSSSRREGAVVYIDGD